tara:strand:+ start:445 stop:636 length:192 start_codon:yes stop_codon:yes gene_type:complete
MMLALMGFGHIWGAIGRVISFGNETIFAGWMILGLFVLLGLAVLFLALLGYAIKKVVVWVVKR